MTVWGAIKKQSSHHSFTLVLTDGEEMVRGLNEWGRLNNTTRYKHGIGRAIGNKENRRMKNILLFLVRNTEKEMVVMFVLKLEKILENLMANRIKNGFKTISYFFRFVFQKKTKIINRKKMIFPIFPSFFCYCDSKNVE